MAVPIVLAETIAVTELYLLYTRHYHGAVRMLNRACSILVGLYFLGIFFYLLNAAVVPLTLAGGWRGIIDVIAVGFYLLGVVPLLGLTLVDLGLVGRPLDEHGRMGLHAGFVALFLVVGHIAMVFGMLDPALMGGAAGHQH